MGPQNERARLARTACFQCRRGKRRCDRTLPSCGLCVRKEDECSYPARRTLNQAHSAATSGSPSTTLSSLSPHSNDHSIPYVPPFLGPSQDTQYVANAVYFISPQIHLQARLEPPRPSLQVPGNVSSIVGDSASIRSIASSFFAAIHLWLPIISKHVFYTYLLNPLAERQTELCLLALSMKLCCTSPSNDHGQRAVKTSLYHTVKSFYFEVESAGFMSIYVLQAGLLIALYELGQAIYPAAYLTVGACARLGLALGVDKLTLASASDDYGPLSWNDVEERRRAWWAVVLFDRFLSLSNPARDLSTNDPTFDSYLPVDDAAWDDNTAKPAGAALISTGFTLKMGRFTRLAQSTFLLSQALRSIRLGPTDTANQEGGPDDLVQLRRTLLSLVHAADVEADVRRLEYCAQSGLSLGAILLLQDQQLGADVDSAHKRVSYQDLWLETRTALDRLLSAATCHLTNSPLEAQASDGIPLFMIHVMYQAACVFLRLAPDPLRLDIQKDMETFKSVLRLLKLRWRLAGVYLDILDTQEITMSADII